MSTHELIILSIVAMLFSSLARSRIHSGLWTFLQIFLIGIAIGQSVHLTKVSNWYDMPTMMSIWMLWVYVTYIRSKTRRDGMRLKLLMTVGMLSLEEMAEILHVSPTKLWFAKHELAHVPAIRRLADPLAEENLFAADSFRRAMDEVGVTFEELETIFGDSHLSVQVERDAIRTCLTHYKWFKKSGSTLIILEDK